MEWRGDDFVGWVPASNGLDSLTWENPTIIDPFPYFKVPRWLKIWNMNEPIGGPKK